MGKFLCTLFLSLAIFTTGFAGDLMIKTRQLFVPNEDGSTTEISVGANAFIFACTIDEHAYQAYATDSQSLYEDYLDGAFFSAENQSSGYTFDGYWEESSLADAEMGDNYVVIIATYDSAEFGRTYYIAKALSVTYSEEMFFDFLDVDVILPPTQWSYLPPPMPVEIECTGIAVSGGVVTATYELSDFSRLNEIADGNTITFNVATSLNRDQDGAIATTTLAGTITATDSAASTVTVTLTPPASATSFFILGTAD